MRGSRVLDGRSAVREGFDVVFMYIPAESTWCLLGSIVESMMSEGFSLHVQLHHSPNCVCLDGGISGCIFYSTLLNYGVSCEMAHQLHNNANRFPAAFCFHVSIFYSSSTYFQNMHLTNAKRWGQWRRPKFGTIHYSSILRHSRPFNI